MTESTGSTDQLKKYRVCITTYYDVFYVDAHSAKHAREVAVDEDWEMNGLGETAFDITLENDND